VRSATERETLSPMSNLNDPLELSADGIRAVRVAERAGAEHLGASVYELQPGDEMVFHYHVHREELLIVLAGRLRLRTAAGWEELPEERSLPSLVGRAERTGTATTATCRFAC
jgi:quercetin dioxygenase-like cupin family protein